MAEAQDQVATETPPSEVGFGDDQMVEETEHRVLQQRE